MMSSILLAWEGGRWGEGTAPLTPFSGGWGLGVGRGEFQGMSTILWAQSNSAQPCAWVCRALFGPPFPVGGCKNSTWFELGAGGGGGPVSLLLEELPAHMLPGALAGRGKRGSKPASGRRRRWKLDHPRLSRLFDLF